VLKKPNRKNAEVVDVPADDPVGTMERFQRGLQKVLASERHRYKVTPRRVRNVRKKRSM
jgi:hypothetical protein